MLVEISKKNRSGLLIGPPTRGLSTGTILRVHHSSQQCASQSTHCDNLDPHPSLQSVLFRDYLFYYFYKDLFYFCMLYL